MNENSHYKFDTETHKRHDLLPGIDLVSIQTTKCKCSSVIIRIIDKLCNIGIIIMKTEMFHTELAS